MATAPPPSPREEVLDLDSPELRTVYERAERTVQVTRAAASVIFGVVIVVNGPVLGVDPPTFTWPALGMAAVTLASGLAALLITARGGHRRWLAWFTIVLDITVVTALGIMLGGARSILPVILLVVIALNGLRLRAAPLIGTVALATAAYLALAAFSTPPEPPDRQVVVLATIWVMGLATLGIVRMGRALATEAMTRLRERLRLQRSVERYFSPQVGRLLMHEPERLMSQRRVVTALFADLSGFTRLSETAPEGVVMDTLDAYLGTLARVAMDHDGTVDNYLGDALLVVFNAPADQPDHADRALRTARQMMEATRQLTMARLADGRAALSVVIGVNSGTATAGNIGASERQQYTVIGDAVNVASRLEALGMPGDIIVGESTARSSGLATGGFETRFVRGRTAPVRYVRIATGVRPLPSPDEQTELGAGARVPRNGPDTDDLGFEATEERETEQVMVERDSADIVGEYGSGARPRPDADGAQPGDDEPTDVLGR